MSSVDIPTLRLFHQKISTNHFETPQALQIKAVPPKTSILKGKLEDFE